MLGLLQELVDYTHVQSDTPTQAIVTNATFRRDFFPWRAGDTIRSLGLTWRSDGVWLQEVEGARIKQEVMIRLTGYAD